MKKTSAKEYRKCGKNDDYLLAYLQLFNGKQNIVKEISKFTLQSKKIKRRNRKTPGEEVVTISLEEYSEKEHMKKLGDMDPSI